MAEGGEEERGGSSVTSFTAEARRRGANQGKSAADLRRLNADQNTSKFIAMADNLDKLLSIASQARREHRHADARKDLVEAVRLARTGEDQIGLAKALTALGQIERDLGNGNAALQHYEQAAAIYRQGSDPLRIAHTIRHLADILQDEGRLQQAEPLYREALALYLSNKQTPPLDLANAIRGLALLTTSSGRAAEATALWEEAHSLYAAEGVDAGVAESSRRLALLEKLPNT
jgi:tetratricopeptide (TPR) repeat protein